MFPQLAQFQDLALLLLRLMVAVVFLTSGWKHVKDPEARGKSIEMSKSATAAIGTAEILGALGVLFGVLTQFVAVGLNLAMPGAIQKKCLSGTRVSGASKARAGITTCCS